MRRMLHVLMLVLASAATARGKQNDALDVKLYRLVMNA